MTPYTWSAEEKLVRFKKAKRPWWRRYKQRFEEALDVKLEPGEDIHHIDYNKHHGCIDNLMCLHKDNHKKLHKRRRIALVETCTGAMCEKTSL